MTDEARCPACGQAVYMDGHIERALREDPRRDVYGTKNGRFAITYGGGIVPWSAVSALEKAGVLRRKWPDKPEIKSWVLSDTSED